MSHSPFLREVPNSKGAVLLIHGILGTPRHFDFLLPQVPDNWSIYNILLDGHGGTVRDFSHTSMKKWHQQVADQLDDILSRHDRIILVAHSMGTLFSIQEAIARPEKIRHLFLLQVPLRPTLRPKYAFFTLFFPFGIILKGAEPMRNGSSLTLTPKLWKYVPWLPRFLELFAECAHTRKILGQLTVPCHAFQACHDEMVRLKSSKDLKKHPHYQLYELQNSGHFCYPDQDAQLIKSEFSKLFQ